MCWLLLLIFSLLELEWKSSGHLAGAAAKSEWLTAVHATVAVTVTVAAATAEEGSENLKK